MLTEANVRLLPAMEAWVRADPGVVSAVLFGSQVRATTEPAAADAWSDVDLHLIVSSPAEIARIDWAAKFPGLGFRLRAQRAATGGVRKVTVIFDAGECDLIVISRGQMGLARWGLALGLHRRDGPLNRALNAMATIMSGGYLFLKGEQSWGKLYRRVVAEMPGVRIDDREAVRLAEEFLCDLLWLRQKVARGEAIAAQRMLHRSLNEIVIQLVHELRLRRGQATFQQARRVEFLLPPDELGLIQVDARCNAQALLAAADAKRVSLVTIMGVLVPAWRPPAGFADLLRRS